MEKMVLARRGKLAVIVFFVSVFCMIFFALPALSGGIWATLVFGKVWIVLCAAGALVFLTLAIRALTQPRIAISYDDRGLYLYEKHDLETFVGFEKLTDVIRVDQDPVGKPNAGSLTVIWSDGRMTLTYVDDADKIRERILELRNEFAERKHQPAEAREKEYWELP